MCALIVKRCFYIKFSIIADSIWLVRSSRPEVFYKKGILRNFAKFTGKHLCQRLFFNKVSGAKAGVAVSNKYEIHLKKKDSLPQKSRRSHNRCSVKEGLKGQAQVFSCEFCEISKSTFFTEQFRRLLLQTAS